MMGSSSAVATSVSGTECRRFESFLPCHGLLVQQQNTRLLPDKSECNSLVTHYWIYRSMESTRLLPGAREGSIPSGSTKPRREGNPSSSSTALRVLVRGSRATRLGLKEGRLIWDQDIRTGSIPSVSTGKRGPGPRCGYQTLNAEAALPKRSWSSLRMRSR